MQKSKQKLVEKTPVIVLLGHVDHGKTSLILAMRGEKVTSGKPGGIITQHVTVSQIEREGKKITFLDTPGHKAFSEMRSRGAKVADIVLLVVDALEGIREQTKEAIFRAKETKVPIVVALNKVDKPGVNLEKIKGELAKEGILVESLGGEIPTVATSALTEKGISELLEVIFLVAEMENLKCDLSKPARGVIIESFLDPKRGPSALAILEEGILKVKDIVATNSTFGKIKILENFEGKKTKNVLPGEAVTILGFEQPPQVGEEFRFFPDIKEAKNFIKKEKEKIVMTGDEEIVVNIILKTDFFGSIEPVKKILENLTKKEKISLRILKAESGEINESDVKLAKMSSSIILGFRTRANVLVKELSFKEKIKIMNFETVYDLEEWAQEYFHDLHKPKYQRVELGKLKVLVDFWKKKNRQIVGAKVIEGKIEKGCLLEIMRADEIVSKGKVVGLQKNKKDIEIGKEKEEVGILYEGEEKIIAGDILIAFKEEK